MKKILLLLTVTTLLMCSCAKSPQDEELKKQGFYTGEKDHVQYPVFGEQDEVANRVIEGMVNSIIWVYKPQDSQGMITYELVREDDVISIAFNGEVMSKDAAHPTKVYECGSFNARTGEIYSLSRFSEINDKFIDDFIQVADLRLAKLEKPVKLEEIYTRDELKAHLQNADIVQEGVVHGTCSYSTSDGLTIRLGIPHAYGDFVEVKMPNTGV